MKKKSDAWFTKLILILVFFCGLCMMMNIFGMNEATELIEGTVEHTYIGGATGKKGGKITSVPMCRVVWYDKDGEKVTYGMPNPQEKYEVGDSYFFEADAETNHFPAQKKGEHIAAFIIGIITCVVVVLIWKVKFGKRKVKKEPQIDSMERRRKEAYNPIEFTAVIKASICNGEQVAGFKNKKTGQFSEVMLIQGEKDLEEFKKRYGVEEIKKEY